MKVRKILPLVLVAPLLASCGGIKGSEPSFDSYSNKVELAAYTTSVTAAVAGSKIGAEALVAKVGSFEAKSSTYGEDSTKGIIAGEEVESSSKSKVESEFRFNAEGLVASEKLSSAAEMAEKAAEEEGSVLHSSSSERVVEVVDYKDAKWLASVNESEKEFTPESLSTDEATDMDAYAKSQAIAGASSTILSALVPDISELTDEEKAGVAFYNDNDGKLFTYVADYTMTAVDIFSFKDATVKVGSLTGTVKEKAQLKLEDNKIRLAVSKHYVYSYAFTADDWANMDDEAMLVKNGDKVDAESIAYTESTIEFKTIDLAKVDVSEYVAIA